MVKKIGIVTLLGYFNYGNRLQNFALQETIKKMGFEVESLRFTDQEGFLSGSKDTNEKQKLQKLKGKTIIEILITIKKYIFNQYNTSKHKNTNRERTRVFKKFTQDFINEIDYPGNESKYDYFVAGSDQVWNPNYIINKPQFLLKFASPEKRISYAASFGISELPSNVSEVFKSELQLFKNISVREDDGKKIIKDLIDYSPEVLVDPTMLLSKEEWLAISSKAINRPDEEYILTYFLGKPPYDARIEIEKLVKEKNLKVINLGDIDEKETFETGPSEFVDYVNNASTFFTDSFHGVVFSILLETPFVVYKREAAGKSMYSRIETILSKFDLKNREAIGFTDSYFEVDFTNSKRILQEEYSKSITFLKDSFDL